MGIKGTCKLNPECWFNGIFGRYKGYDWRGNCYVPRQNSRQVWADWGLSWRGFFCLTQIYEKSDTCIYLEAVYFCAVYVGQFIEFLIYNGYTWTRDYTTDDVYRQNSTIIEELTDERSGEKRIPKLQEQVSRGVEKLPRTACYLMSGSLFSLRVVLNAESGALRSQNTPGGYGSLAFSGEAR